MYNTYQNRIATARASYELVIQGYNNAITEARLNNSSVLAEIAAKALEDGLKLSIEGVQYKNELLQKKADRKLQIQQFTQTKYQDVLDQMNKENALAEEVRQANLANDRALEEIQLAKDKFAYEKEQDAKAATISKGSSGGGGGNSGGSGSKGSSGGSASISTTKNGNKTSTTTTVKKKTSDAVQIDMDSVLALGFGPISAAKLDDLVRQGIVSEYISDGKRKFKKTAHTLKQGQLYNIMFK
jgi:hypothetical protein